jgi:hypothetical protein
MWEEPRRKLLPLRGVREKIDFAGSGFEERAQYFSNGSSVLYVECPMGNGRIPEAARRKEFLWPSPARAC